MRIIWYPDKKPQQVWECVMEVDGVLQEITGYLGPQTWNYETSQCNHVREFIWYVVAGPCGVKFAVRVADPVYMFQWQTPAGDIIDVHRYTAHSKQFKMSDTELTRVNAYIKNSLSGEVNTTHSDPVAALVLEEIVAIRSKHD